MGNIALTAPFVRFRQRAHAGCEDRDFGADGDERRAEFEVAAR